MSKIKYLFIAKSACKESKQKIDLTMTHIKPIKGTMTLHAVIPVSGGCIAVRDTWCFCAKCYFTDGTLHPTCEGWVMHTLSPVEPEREVTTAPKVAASTSTKKKAQKRPQTTKAKTAKAAKTAKTAKAAKPNAAWYCFLCSESTPEDMIKCQACGLWAHVACSAFESSAYTYVCELCR